MHERNNGVDGKGWGGLCFMQLNLGHFLSFCLDNERVDKLTKMDHGAKKTWELNCGPHWGVQKKDWSVNIPKDYFTQSFTEPQY